jgi:hypothetical protein
MTNLTIIRDSGYADRLRAYRVVVDGSEIGRIRDGETRSFLVTPGKHRLPLKIDWCGSKQVEFMAVDGVPVTFQAKSNLRGTKLAAALWHSLFAWNSWLTLEPAPCDSKALN